MLFESEKRLLHLRTPIQARVSDDDPEHLNIERTRQPIEFATPIATDRDRIAIGTTHQIENVFTTGTLAGEPSAATIRLAELAELLNEQ